jgi:hypothetical protein
MPVPLLYWLIMFIWLIFSGWAEYGPNPYNRGLRYVLAFLLFLIIGWHLFGSPVK